MDPLTNLRLKGEKRVEKEEREGERELFFYGPHTKLVTLEPLGGANVLREVNSL